MGTLAEACLFAIRSLSRMIMTTGFSVKSWSWVRIRPHLNSSDDNLPLSTNEVKNQPEEIYNSLPLSNYRMNAPPPHTHTMEVNLKFALKEFQPRSLLDRRWTSTPDNPFDCLKSHLPAIFSKDNCPFPIAFSHLSLALFSRRRRMLILTSIKRTKGRS